MTDADFFDALIERGAHFGAVRVRPADYRRFVRLRDGASLVLSARGILPPGAHIVVDRRAPPLGVTVWS